MSLNIPLPPAESAQGDVADVYNALTDRALNQQKQRIANKYAPLTTAIKAQNALTYGGKTGNVGLFLRSLSQMPVAERQAYLADPANRRNYMNMLEQFRTEINNPQAGGNILTPQFMQQFGFGPQQQQQTSSNPISQLMSLFSGGSQNAVQQPPQVQPRPVAPVMQETPQQVEQPTQNIPIEPQQPIQQSSADTETPKLSTQGRATLNSQMRANNQNVGPEMKNRADASIAFEKFLQLHRKEIGKYFNDAFKYSQIYGHAKNWLDKFKTNQPKEYANFIKARDSLLPLMAGGLRRLEGMGVSHEAQEDAKAQIAGALRSIDISPQTAIDVFNSHMKALADVSEGNMTAAEPQFPGVRYKLAGIKPFRGNYIPMRIEVIDSQGRKGTIPEDQWEEAKKKKYKRVK